MKIIMSNIKNKGQPMDLQLAITKRYDGNNVPTPISDKHVLDDPSDISDSITAMSKYFVGARPNSKGRADLIPSSSSSSC